MQQISKSELLNINGGAISASLITSIVRGINSLLDLGRSFGSAIRRIITGSYC